MLNKIFPPVADNNFAGHSIVLWAFILFTVVMTWRSIIHMFFEAYGFHDIANFIAITGDPDPMVLIYRFFSLWGFAQLIFCMVCWVVIFRYRALIPLMYLLWTVEWTYRTFGYDSLAVQGLYTTGITPGAVLAPYAMLLLLVLFGLSLLNEK